MENILIPIVAGLVGLIVGFVIFRRPAEAPTDPYLRPLEQLSRTLRDGRAGHAEPTEPQAVTEVREAVTAGWVPRNAHLEEALSQSLGRVAAFLEESVQKPLREVRSGDAALLREGVDRALGGIADLEFFLRDPITPDETHNVVALATQATQDFIRDWEVGVRMIAPQFPVRAHVHRETFKDSLYLLLNNAAQFGKGGTIELRVEEADGQVRVVVADDGPGFSEEALKRARDLFYTTRPSGLGLGIPFARKIIEGFGGNLELANRPEGGAEVRLTLPKA